MAKLTRFVYPIFEVSDMEMGRPLPNRCMPCPFSRLLGGLMRSMLVLFLTVPLITQASKAPSLQLVAETDSTAVAAHVAKAKEVAGDKFAFLANGFLCKPAANAIPHAIRTIPGFLDPEAPGVEPFKAFDNLYYAGLYAIGTWILDTDDGLIVFDALNNEGEVRSVLLPDMAEMGLNPQDMKYVVITHGHFDHYGGADFLKSEFGPRVAMSGPDWNYLPNDIALPYARLKGYPAVTQPKRDLIIEEGQTIVMGNASVKFIVTPGHTPGTLSSIITVRDGGKERKVGMWGGQALPRGAVELAQMHESLHKFWDEARAEGVEALISTHAWVVGNFELRKRSRGVAQNPLMIGREGVDQVLGTYDQCIKAEFARMQAKQIRPRH